MLAQVVGICHQGRNGLKYLMWQIANLSRILPGIVRMMEHALTRNSTNMERKAPIFGRRVMIMALGHLGVVIVLSRVWFQDDIMPMQ